MSVNFSVPNSDGLTPWKLAHMLLNQTPLLGSGAYACRDDENNQSCTRIFLFCQQLGSVHITNRKKRKVSGEWMETVEGVVSDNTPDELVSAAATTLSYNMRDVFRLR